MDAGWVSILDAASERGSEGGVVLWDDEHELGARISLERTDGDACEITCGIYGLMVHTCFFKTVMSACEAYVAMKADLAAILMRMPRENDPDREEKRRAAEEDVYAFIDRYS